jgi:hypothetical protein
LVLLAAHGATALLLHHRSATLLRPLESLTAHARAPALWLHHRTRSLLLALETLSAHTWAAALLHHGSTSLLLALEALTAHGATALLLAAHHGCWALPGILGILTAHTLARALSLVFIFPLWLTCLLILLHTRGVILAVFILSSLSSLFFLLHPEGATSCCAWGFSLTDLAAIGFLFV